MYFFQKHEPAIIEEEYFPILEKAGLEDFQISEEPPCILKKVNRYLIEKESFSEFVKKTSGEYNFYFIVSFVPKKEHFSKIQLLFSKKKMITNNWRVENKDSDEEFLFKMVPLLEEDIEFLDNLSTFNLFLMSKKDLSVEILKKTIKKIDLNIHPRNFGGYIPSVKALNTLIEENISLGFFKTSYYEGYDSTKERTIVVLYSPWNMKWIS